MQDITKMKDAELSELISEKRETIRGFRFNPTARDVRAVRDAKKDVARALTEQNRRAHEAAAS